MIWEPRETFDVERMVRHAARRGLVRLDDGHVATLVSWPGTPRRKGKHHCRLENANGTRFTVHVSRVAEVEVSDW